MKAIDVTMLANADEKAWTRFFGVHAPMLRDYAAYKGAAEPDDVVQNVMLKFFKALRRGAFRANTVEDFVRYLKTLARNQVVDDFRRAKARCRDMTVELDEFAIASPCVTRHIVEKREEDALRQRSVARVLSEWVGSGNEKRIYVACVLNGRSVVEMAREMGKSPNTVSQIKHRAVCRMAALCAA